MTYGGAGMAAQIFRRGGEADVLTKSTSGTNDFGNTDHSYDLDRTVLAAKTYPNRNEDIESAAGDRQEDNPVFMIPIGDDQPAPPDEGDHLIYDGQEYEVGSYTPYDTHVEFFAEPVIH
jgi:hypothetical protein